MLTNQTPQSAQVAINRFFKEKSNFIETANDWLDELQIAYCEKDPILANGASEFIADLRELLNDLNNNI